MALRSCHADDDDSRLCHVWAALQGPFLLDDTYLPYDQAEYPLKPLSAWLKGVRPMLMFSYWLISSKSDRDRPLSRSECDFAPADGRPGFFDCPESVDVGGRGTCAAESVRCLCGGSIPVASFANRVGQLCREPVGSAERLLLPGRFHRVPVSPQHVHFLAGRGDDPGPFWSRLPDERARRGTARFAAADRLFLEPRFLLAGGQCNWKLYLPMAGRRSRPGVRLEGVRAPRPRPASA